MTIMQNTKIVQNCYVVKDLEEAAYKWNRMFGIGPFIGGQEVFLNDHTYRGRVEAPIGVRGLFAQAGELNIELVELTSTTPSAFHDMFPEGQEGLHHVACVTAHYEKERDAFVAAGFPVASEFIALGKKFCYIDARDTLGHMIELYPQGDKTLAAMYQKTKDASAAWDGNDLIIPWDLTGYDVESAGDQQNPLESMA